MKYRIFATMALATVLLCYASRTFAAEAGQMVLGGYYNNGIAFEGGHGVEDWRIADRYHRTPKFSLGGGAYFDFYFTGLIGLEAGLGFLNKGVRFADGDEWYKENLVYMELPVMIKFNIKGFEAAAGLALFVGLTGRSVDKNNDDDRFIHPWNKDDWDYVHRVNFGPKIVLGYAIPVGPIAIVPGMSWMIHLVNDLDNKEIDKDYPFIDNPDFQARAMNLMFFVAAEWTVKR